MKTYDIRKDPRAGNEFHDFCLVTAKPDELREVKAVFGTHFDRLDEYKIGPAVYAVRREGRGKLGKRVLVTCCDGMGHVFAATKTAQVAVKHKPWVMIFVGTAASLNPESVRLGDVIVPSASTFLFYDKIVQEGERAYQSEVAQQGFREYFFQNCILMKDKKTTNLPENSLDILSDIDFSKIPALEDAGLGGEWGQLIARDGKVRLPKVEVDAEIVTCGMVVNSESYRKYLLSQAGRKTAAIDMESFGFFHTLEKLAKSGVVAASGLMVRGISDYAGRKESTELDGGSWKGIASRNAAVVAANVVKQLAMK